MSRCYVADTKKPGLHLGTWTLPSGKVIDVYVWLKYGANRDLYGDLLLRWTKGASDDPEDMRHYFDTIEPDIAATLRHYAEMSHHDRLFFGPLEHRIGEAKQRRGVRP